MSFVKTAGLLVHASQPVVWVRTHESTEARNELSEGFKDRVLVYRWNILNGLTNPAGVEMKLNNDDGMGETSLAGSSAGLITAIAVFRGEVNRASAADESKKDKKDKKPDTPPAFKHFVLLVDNFHQFTMDRSPAMYPVIQALQDFSSGSRNNPCSIMLISHYIGQIPDELKSYCSIVDHDLPSSKELQVLTEQVLSTVQGPTAAVLDNIDANHITKLAQAGLGLSRLQYESELAYALADVAEQRAASEEASQWDESVVTEKVVQGVQDRKAALFNAEGLVRLHRSPTKVDALGGMQGLKDKIKKRFDHQDKRYRKDRYPRGLILLGPPGTGKTTFARAVGDMLGVLTAAVDLGGTKQGVVGSSEGRTIRTLQILNAMGRIVVYIDEIGLVFPVGEELDAGVSRDMRAKWLDALSDPNRQFYVIGSANKIKDLGPVLRHGRFDHTVMVDIPKPEQQALIWTICMKAYGIPSQILPPHDQWTGQEIETCCDWADGEGITLMEAAELIVPEAKRDPVALAEVRDYAHNSGRAIDAETGRIYRKPGSEPVLNTPASVKKKRHIVSPNPLDN